MSIKAALGWLALLLFTAAAHAESARASALAQQPGSQSLATASWAAPAGAR